MTTIPMWNAHTDYEPGDVCLYAGRVWRAIAPSRGQAPAGSGPWQRESVTPQAAAGNQRGNPHVTEVGP